MLELFNTIFTPGNFEPHFVHFLDNQELMWSIIIGNALLALAYFMIPFFLYYFVKKRNDLVFNWVFLAFAAFILSCGITHLMHIVIFWYPAYWLQSIIDGAAGIISIATAIALFPVVPKALKIPSPKQLEEANNKLSHQIAIRKKAEAQVKKLNKELEERVKQRTMDLQLANEELKQIEQRKDDFISMASHELKTPITSMTAYTYALEKKLKNFQDEQAIYYISKIQQQIDKQTKLVSDLLDVTRLQGNHLRTEKSEFDLIKLVEETVSDIQSTISSHKILIKSRKLNKNVFADRERISQVLVNFISNAIKFSPKADKIIINVSQKDNEAVVSVKDFGIGIAEKHLAKIFDRYYRVFENDEKTFPGLGVGLYIVSSIINQNNGRVWVESLPNKGSIFYFTVPFAK